ncbi:hypothetical protein EGR_10651 [Echinococcus granulosus]|uniref:Uncharacterized protein n=1 Tax=Echinococcus granulosus TaxID=6210 RepID=W6U0E9_ECHGR|nr:hypothetical protein EGR_10651 [Echinococcus granulosus]EUB54483.1 hypothetical protein EGR_10651 [Echinococcus granulosus]
MNAAAVTAKGWTPFLVNLESQQSWETCCRCPLSDKKLDIDGDLSKVSMLLANYEMFIGCKHNYLLCAVRFVKFGSLFSFKTAQYRSRYGAVLTDNFAESESTNEQISLSLHHSLVFALFVYPKLCQICALPIYHLLPSLITISRADNQSVYIKFCFADYLLFG